MGMVRQEMQMRTIDKRAIEQYARAAPEDPDIDLLRKGAREVFLFYLEREPRERWNAHMKFMSEVDSPAPDYGLRAHYRQQLLEQK